MNEIIELLLSLDADAMLLINRLQGHPLIDSIMIFLSVVANDGYAGAAMAGVMWIFGKQQAKATAVLIVTGLLLAYGIGLMILKPLVARPRPFVTFDEVQVLTSASGFSFPSGHALVAGIVAFLIWGRHPHWGLPAVTIALLVAFSRVYNGVHYPFDTVAGLLIAGIISFILHKLAARSRYFNRIA